LRSKKKRNQQRKQDKVIGEKSKKKENSKTEEEESIILKIYKFKCFNNTIFLTDMELKALNLMFLILSQLSMTLNL